AKTDARLYFEMGEQCKSMGLIEMSRQYMEEAAKKTTDKDLKAQAENFIEIYLPQETIDLADSKSYLTGRTAEVAGDFISAEKIYSELASKNSKFFWPQVALARVYREYGDLTKAEKSAKKALAINKKSVEALIELAKINQDRGRTGRGIAAIKRALKIDSDNQMAKFVNDSLSAGSEQEQEQ
ncbi:MAG: tetratricopeptide repeat protein, partial [Cyanobacteria bacterium HKST-UBA01]|nr:tetratricopeptide repeat protein [Cyanobacteria bacterium HKST-UBA01]